MRRSDQRHLKKRRTRAHIVADLAVNIAERMVLRAGHTVESIAPDYGLDLVIRTFDEAGRPERGLALLQVKGSEQLRRLRSGEIAFTIEQGDLTSWLAYDEPVALVLYDAASDRGYWIHVQAHFAAGTRIDSTRPLGEHHVTHQPNANVGRGGCQKSGQCQKPNDPRSREGPP